MQSKSAIVSANSSSCAASEKKMRDIATLTDNEEGNGRLLPVLKHRYSHMCKRPAITRSKANTAKNAPNYLPLQKFVTFSLPPKQRDVSAPPLFRSRSVKALERTQSALNYQDFSLRDRRYLPTAPNRHPLSPTIPVAKLRLFREILGSGNHQKERRSISPIGKGSLSISSSTPASPIRSLSNGYTSPVTFHKESSQLPTPSTSVCSFPTYSQVTKPPCLTKHPLEPPFLMDGVDPEYYRRRKYIPLCKSAPSPSPANSPSLSKYVNSPLLKLRNELKYCVEERKRALGIVESDYRPHRSSESDLNALLHLYSFPPDRVLENTPPPGVPNYQRVPQYVLRRNASYPSLECESDKYYRDFYSRPSSPYPESVDFDYYERLPYSWRSNYFY